MAPAQIVILNGPSRSGKTSIAQAMQETHDELWMNIGMDLHIAATAPAYRPGVGLRPQRAEGHVSEPGRVELRVLEDLVPVLYAAMYESIAAHARLGLNVVTDVYHHDYYSSPPGILNACARRLLGLPVLFVGVLCPIDVIWERREATWGQHREAADDRLLLAVELHQRAARQHSYDMALDTSRLTPDECAEAIRQRIAEGPPGSAFAELARARAAEN